MGWGMGQEGKGKERKGSQQLAGVVGAVMPHDGGGMRLELAAEAGDRER
jgi:hypothetical protein